ncbi:MAG: glucose 1-dehydrogenase [Clostridiaceae bacterium]|jgi:NAD(P)-dependent dehydrogenase (short-subunit alcohol dehydrogenase family)|nr:glucose 1-dehydrogenase [Clostridiaceae bacterium]
MKLQNKVAVVTGAASGTGKAIAELFAREGAKVMVSDINIDGAKEVVSGIEKNGGIAAAVYANVANEADVSAVIDFAVEKFGTLDILVNNAGIMDEFMPVNEVTDEIWERVLAVNLTGPMRAIRKAMPIFLEKSGGVIINIASIGGLGGSRAGAAYTASKHALIGLTRNVGFQFAGLGIRCNAIAPGAIRTSIESTIKNPSKFGYERATVGMNLNPRIAEPEEIAAIALFLASDDSSFINASVITADSGWTAY